VNFVHETVRRSFPAQDIVKRAFSRVAEWRVTQVMSLGNRVYQIDIETEAPSDNAGNGRNVQNVFKTRADVIVIRSQEDLSLVLQAAKGGRVNDACLVACELQAKWIGLYLKPPPL